MLGVIARAGGPRSLLDLDVDIFVALLEGVAREDPGVDAHLDDLYDAAAAAAAPAPEMSRAERNSEIARVQALFGR